MHHRLLSTVIAVLSAVCVGAADSVPEVASSRSPTAMLTEPVSASPPESLPWDRRPIMDDHTGPWNSVWLGGGFGLYWIKDAPIDMPLASTGALGSPQTTALLGDTNVGYGPFNTLLLNAGLWFNSSHTIGFAADGFISDHQLSTASIASEGSGHPQIVRPFFNPLQVSLGGQDGFIVSDPNRYAGAMAITTGARIAGVQTNGVLNLKHTVPGITLHFLTGWRYWDLDESLTVYQSTAPLGASSIPFLGEQLGVGSGLAITDRIRTRNQFYGGQLGVQSEYRYQMLIVGLGTTLGVGPVHQVIEVNGQTSLTGSRNETVPGGFLAVGPVPNGTAAPTVAYGNIGRYVTNRMAVLADVKASLGLQLSERWRAFVGYDFLYLTDVVRPGNQFSLSVDPRLVPASTSYGGRTTGTPTVAGLTIVPPPSPGDHSDFFIHGVRWTVEFVY